MGRAASRGEAQSVARARNAVTVYGVLALVFGVGLWAFQDGVVAALIADVGRPVSAPEAAAVADLVRFMTYLYLGTAVVYLLSAVGMQRVWTLAWVTPTAAGLLTLVGIVGAFLDTPTLPLALALVVNAWVMSRLAEPDVVRAFFRRRKGAPAPVVEEPAWRPPAVTPFPVAQPIAMPATPVVPPPPPSTPRQPFDYFG